jgi:hypothetical protein
MLDQNSAEYSCRSEEMKSQSQHLVFATDSSSKHADFDDKQIYSQVEDCTESLK